MKLMFKDLPCYRDLTKEQKKHKLYTPNSSFDLSRLPPTEIRYDFAALIYDKAEKTSYLTLHIQRTNFHKLADFLSDSYPTIEHLTDVPLQDMERKLRIYLVKDESKLSYDRYRAELGKTYRSDNPVLYYLRTAYEYFLPKKEASFDENDDIWRIESLPFPVRDSPIRILKQVNFSRIKQAGIKKETKDAILYHFKRRAAKTVTTELSAMSYLSEYLSETHSEIDSLKDFNRKILEEYLGYIYLESSRKKDYRTELSALKSVFIIIGKLYEYDHLRGIFLKSDFPQQRKTIYRSYSDNELARLHEGYKILDKQTARLLLIHELLGLRISDTLTIKTEDVDLSDNPHVRIIQPKTGNALEKKLNPDLCALFAACIEETTNTYGKCEYVFVYEKDPKIPQQYSVVEYRIKRMIRKLDLRDDNGNLFTVGTHLLRHTYGKKLCDLLNDDSTIAALLGHKSTTCVSFYRQMSPKVLAESTKEVIDARNEKIKKFKKGWML